MKILTIHATNVTGLGAAQVVCSILHSFERVEHSFDRIVCYVPSSGPVSEYLSDSPNFEVKKISRGLPKSLSRVMECLFPAFYFNLGDNLIVLGDVPLRTKIPQLLFIHQPHLVFNSVNPNVGNGLLFKIMRGLTWLNSGYAKKVIVQTDAMKQGILDSYLDWKRRECVYAMKQPAPDWFNLSQSNHALKNYASGLKLFYPAAGYPHKNHQLISDMVSLDIPSGVIDEVRVTLGSDHFSENQSKLLKFLGRLDQGQCLIEYERADALVFPSLLESYGLPLVEAMTAGIPILVADLPYAHTLCGDEAIYFDPMDAKSLLDAITECHRKLTAGWSPDWSEQLAELPSSWDEVASFFLKQLAD